MLRLGSVSLLSPEATRGPRQDERALRLSLLTRGQSEGGQSGGTGPGHSRAALGTWRVWPGQTAQSEELPEE